MSAAEVVPITDLALALLDADETIDMARAERARIARELAQRMDARCIDVGGARLRRRERTVSCLVDDIQPGGTYTCELGRFTVTYVTRVPGEWVGFWADWDTPGGRVHRWKQVHNTMWFREVVFDIEVER